MNLFWTKYTQLESYISATDPLALDYTAQQLGYLPLPNFTTRTSRARYYSAVCFGLMICDKTMSRYKDYSPDRDTTLSKLYELYEKYWAYAVVLSYDGLIHERDENEKDLRGKRGALKAVSKQIKTLGDEYRLLSRQLELGGLGAYRSSLERFGLIKTSSLTLTMKGQELAEKFLPVGAQMRTQYEELLIESLHQGRIIEKHGRASIKNFGRYACLDMFRIMQQDSTGAASDEKDFLCKTIIEGEAITHATAKLAVSHQDLFQDIFDKQTDIMSGIAALSTTNPTDEAERHVVDSFKTIHSFELLSIQLNKAFCVIVKAAYDNGGKIGIKELADLVEPILRCIISKQLAAGLAATPMYHKLSGYYYGSEFLTLMTVLRSSPDVEQFIRIIHAMHLQVETKRRSGVWFDIEGDQIIAFSGYEYSKENMDRKHSYKLPNLFSLINDLGWAI